MSVCAIAAGSAGEQQSRVTAGMTGFRARAGLGLGPCVCSCFCPGSDQVNMWLVARTVFELPMCTCNRLMDAGMKGTFQDFHSSLVWEFPCCILGY